MGEQPLITVCTQVYNTKPYLTQCIESILAQTYTNFEYFLVDNGCTDGSEKIIKDYSEKDKRIKRFRFEINQYAVSFQLIKQYASGKYYTILDSDDWVDPNYLEELLGFAEKNSLDIACTGTVMHHMANEKQDFRKVDQGYSNSYDRGDGKPPERSAI